MLLFGCALSLRGSSHPRRAGAATAAVDRPCYPGDGSSIVTITGSGFAPNDAVQLQIQGGIVGATTADAAGNVKTTFPVPTPPTAGPAKNEQAYPLTLVQGAVRARRRSAPRASRATSGRRPGSPATLKVRFTATGFGVATPAGQPMPAIYVHYVDPRGKVAPDGRASARGRRRAARSPRRRCAGCSRSTRGAGAGPAVRHEPGLPPRHRRQPVPVRPPDADDQLTAAAGSRSSAARSTSSPSSDASTTTVWPSAERAVEDAQRERVDEALLDHPLQRAGAVGRGRSRGCRSASARRR